MRRYIISAEGYTDGHRLYMHNVTPCSASNWFTAWRMARKAAKRDKAMRVGFAWRYFVERVTY